MRTRRNPKGRATKPLQVGLAALLMLTLNLSAFAVVFTNPAPITINDRTSTTGSSTPYPSTIVSSGLTGTITNVTVTLSNFNHTFPDDVDVLLVGPGGQKYILMSDVGGGNGLNNVTLTFDDTGTALPDSGLIGSGVVRPTNIGATDTFPAPAPGTPYSNPPTAGTATFATVFGGGVPNGNWDLYIGDDAAGDVGLVANGWSVTITTSANPATTFSNATPIRINDPFGRSTPYPSTISVTGLTGVITDVNVTLTNMNHTFPQDIAVLLVGPKGQNLILMSQAVGDDLTPLANTTLTFDDSAGTLLPTSGGVATGSFRPATYAIVDFPAPAPISPPNYPTLGGSSTLATAFNGTDPNGTWSLYVVDVAPPDPGSIAGGWSIDITAGGNVRRFTNSDFDGDGRSDVSVWNPTTHNWSIRDSSTFKYRTVFDWGNGSLGDRPVPGDYDGDGKTDVAVFRASEGNWYIIQSSTGTPTIKNWGQSGDIPVQADYDRDGKTDVAVYRAGTWYIQASGGVGIPAAGWGNASDIPVTGDYDGDGKSDLAVYRSSENNWYIKNSGAGTNTVVNWGTSGDRVVPGDYDGDQKTDIAVWRSSNGNWYIRRSVDGGVQTRTWGDPGDQPVPADYDGDNKADIAVWRGSQGNWFILQSAISGITPDNRNDNLGLSVTGDIPTPRGYFTEPLGPSAPERQTVRATRAVSR
jgi:subtilisin-like proprotein convertase family protein